MVEGDAAGSGNEYNLCRLLLLCPGRWGHGLIVIILAASVSNATAMSTGHAAARSVDCIHRRRHHATTTRS